MIGGFYHPRPHNISEDRQEYTTLGLIAMGVEIGIVRTHIHTSHLRHVHILEELYGVLYPEAHSNGSK